MGNPFDESAPFVLDPATNPFRPGVGKVPPVFGGRNVALRRAKVIVDRLAAGVDPDLLLMHGVRGVGKTALMAYVRNQAALRGIAVAHIEADRGDDDLVATMGGLVRDLRELLDPSTLGKLSRSLTSMSIGSIGIGLADHATGDRGLEGVLADVGAVAAGRKVGVLLTVDEVHEAEDTLLRPLIRGLHRLSQDARPVGMIAAGLPGAGQKLMDEGQTYTERLDRISLDLLDDEATAEAIREPFGAASVEVDDAVMDACLRGAAGYPYFVQVWGAALWDSATRTDAVTVEVLPAARRLVSDRVDRFFGDRAARVPTGRARLVVTALARLGGDAAVADILAEAEITADQFSPVREVLLSRGLAHVPIRGRLAFSAPGFAAWVDRHGLADADRT